MTPDFSFIDWLVLVIVLISAVLAAVRGFVRELIGMGSLVLAFLFAAWFYPTAAEIFKDVVLTENLALFCGFSIIFLGTLVAGLLFAWIVAKFVKAAKLQWFDRFLGALFGFVRGWIVGGMVFFALTAFHIQESRVRESELAPYFLPASRLIAFLTPLEVKEQFHVGYAAIEQWWTRH
jgi:membrane protein required for colicin V production